MAIILAPERYVNTRRRLLAADVCQDGEDLQAPYGHNIIIFNFILA